MKQKMHVNCTIDEINKWTENQKMIINPKKTKTVIFNFTDYYQFTTRLKLNKEIVEVLWSRITSGGI